MTRSSVLSAPEQWVMHSCGDMVRFEDEVFKGARHPLTVFCPVSRAPCDAQLLGKEFTVRDSEAWRPRVPVAMDVVLRKCKMSAHACVHAQCLQCVEYRRWLLMYTCLFADKDCKVEASAPKRETCCASP